MYRREDWTLFRSLTTLPSAAGIAIEKLRALVVRELVDNALDASPSQGSVRLTYRDDEGRRYYIIEDAGPGIEIESIADLFSLKRPLTSSKLVRLPTRGALGNGLRVVTGAVKVPGGSLMVETHGQRFEVRPLDDGTTDVEESGTSEIEQGMRITLSLGSAIPLSHDDMRLGLLAIRAAGDGAIYKGKPSPHWYDSESFFELMQAAPGSVRAEVNTFDGCTGNRAAEIIGGQGNADTLDFRQRLAQSLSREEADQLLSRMRKRTRPPKPTRFSLLGKEAFNGRWAKQTGTFYSAAQGTHEAAVPFTVEAWVQSAERDGVTLYVNRTPVAANYRVYRQKGERARVVLFGCEIRDFVKVGTRASHIVVNVQTPFMPITSTGKEPNLLPFRREIIATIEKAARSMNKAQPTPKAPDIKRIILKNLDAAIARTSDSRKYRYSLRNLYYSVRPFVLEYYDDLKYGTFKGIITDFEEEVGRDLPGIYRDDRGTLYHPHTGESIKLGTREVEAYTWPEWTFNKILYIEKEGFFPLLKDSKWPEKNDCALLTSKGYATRAARDIIDLMGDSTKETDEDLLFFCIHDADGPGTMIYQSLQGATKARKARTVKIINLGLEPWEGLAMGLPHETFERKKKGVPVADYVKHRDRFGDDETFFEDYDESVWEGWLQTHRYELSAMTPAQLLTWLDEKMAPYSGKVIPPAETIGDELTERTRTHITKIVTADILDKAGLQSIVEDYMESLDGQLADDDLPAFVDEALLSDQALLWSDAVEGRAADLAADATQDLGAEDE